MKRIALLIFSLFSLSYAASLKNISYSEFQVKTLRKEVAFNMRLSHANQKVEINWLHYTIQKGDNFFKIMKVTMLNHDTLSSVNRLASLYDIKRGDKWLIPNARGIAVYGEPEELAKKYNIDSKKISKVPNTKNLWFIVGQRFSSEERSFFNLNIFIRPVAGRISSKYGMRKDPFKKKRRFHKGIDIACKKGSRIKAAAQGKVVFTGWKGGYGKTVIIEHKNGYRTLYGHLSRYQVKKNQTVSRGKTIAYSGSTGYSTGPHLHFEVRRKGQFLSPSFSRNRSHLAQKTST